LSGAGCTAEPSSFFSLKSTDIYKWAAATPGTYTSATAIAQQQSTQ